MMEINHKYSVIILFFLALGLVLGMSIFLFIQSQKENIYNNTSLQESIPSEHISTTIKSPLRNIAINATTSEIPSSVPIYWATIREDEVVSKLLGDITSTKHNVTSEKNAPEASKRVMESYGGLPSDAMITRVATEYLYTQSMTGEITSQEPILTEVIYERKLNGLTECGHETDFIALTFGENDELLTIGKQWRNLTRTGNVSLIPASSVLEQLRYNDTMLDQDRVLDSIPAQKRVNISIYNVTLCYFGTEEKNSYLEPVWVFWGGIDNYENFRSEPSITFIVNARKFADFSATNHSLSVSEPITFTDKSQTNATKWFWEFGDGTNSTLQNPIHRYKKNGNFTVNFTVWNTFGKDQHSRVNYISVLPNQIGEIRPSVTGNKTTNNGYKEP